MSGLGSVLQLRRVDNQSPGAHTLTCTSTDTIESGNDVLDSAAYNIPDLNAVVGAAGIHVLSYLPTGDLINGHRSPSLVSTLFHDAVYKALGQREVLSFSGCGHLRKIKDDALIRLLRTIIEVSKADDPAEDKSERQVHVAVSRRRNHDCVGCSRCPCPINAWQFLDLSRCRQITGQAVHYALRHTPNVRRISVSSAVRFHAAKEFCLPKDRDQDAPSASFPSVLTVPKLEALDISGCSKVDTLGVETLTTYITGHQIRHLDLSGCSTTLDNRIAAPIAEWCRRLEYLGLAGLKKLTSCGVGLMAYCCRDTLRGLNLRGCENVYLTEILLPTMFEMRDVCIHMINNFEQPTLNRDAFISLLPPSFVRDTLDDYAFLRTYCVNFMTATDHMGSIRQMDNWNGFAQSAQSYASQFKLFEERLTASERKSDARLFGMLEQLDVSNTEKRSHRLQGCLSAIAWLSGGRLREVNISGLSTVSGADLIMLALTSGPRLKILEASSSLSQIRHTDPPVPINHIFSVANNISELDLSCCNAFVAESPDSRGLGSFPPSVASLRLDQLSLTSDDLLSIFSLQQLLKLSIVGCTNVTTRDIWHCAKTYSPVLLELDAREVEVTKPWSNVLEEIPSLLRLNNRRTARGTKVIKEHVRVERWRNGGRDPKNAGKRKHDDGSTATSNVAAPLNIGSRDIEPTLTTCCSILRTGFSKDLHTEQEMFACGTCSIDSGRFVCCTCATNCHQGHDVVPVGYGYGHCDCALLSTCDSLDVPVSR